MLSKLSSALYTFELELNSNKTSVHGVGQPHPYDGIHFVRSFAFSSVEKEREELDSFFDRSIWLADRHPDDNIIKFAVATAQGFLVRREGNFWHLVRWMLYCARRAPEALPTVVSFLVEARSGPHSIPVDTIKEHIFSELKIRSGAGHVFEVAWLLFLAREFQVSISADSLSDVLKLRSSVCALCTLDLNQQGFISGRLDTSHWQSFANEEGLKSSMWLAAYEITKKRWWPSYRRMKFAREHKFFGTLWANDVEFYDRAKIHPTRPLRFIGSGRPTGDYLF